MKKYNKITKQFELYTEENDYYEESEKLRKAGIYHIINQNGLFIVNDTEETKAKEEINKISIEK